jgi:thiamine monophosphate kinase
MAADNAVDYAHTSPERMMWQMVLLTAIEDAMLPARSSREDIDAKRDAQRWLRVGGADFRAVCNYAGFDPDHVRDAYLAGRIQVEVTRIGRNIGFQKRIVA